MYLIWSVAIVYHNILFDNEGCNILRNQEMKLPWRPVSISVSVDCSACPSPIFSRTLCGGEASIAQRINCENKLVMMRREWIISLVTTSNLFTNYYINPVFEPHVRKSMGPSEFCILDLIYCNYLPCLYARPSWRLAGTVSVHHQYSNTSRWSGDMSDNLIDS